MMEYILIRILEISSLQAKNQVHMSWCLQHDQKGRQHGGRKVLIKRKSNNQNYVMTLIIQSEVMPFIQSNRKCFVPNNIRNTGH